MDGSDPIRIWNNSLTHKKEHKVRNTEWDGFCGDNKIPLQSLPQQPKFPPKINTTYNIADSSLSPQQRRRRLLQGPRKLVYSPIQPSSVRIGGWGIRNSIHRCCRWKIYNLLVHMQMCSTWFTFSKTTHGRWLWLNNWQHNITEQRICSFAREPCPV